MDRSNEEWTITEGTDVVGSDGDKVGEVVAVQDQFIVVEKGFFFPSDYYIPTSAVSNFDGDKVYLSVTKDEALNQGWDTEPTATTTTDTGAVDTFGTTAADPNRDTTADNLTGTSPLGGSTTDVDRDVAYAGDTAGVDRDAGFGDTRTAAAGDTMTVQAQEEELTATKRDVDRGSVSVQKDVVEEERTLDVPVTEERVTVQRRTVDRDATADDTAFAGGSIEVPVTGQEVDVEKRAHVTEEVEIGKEAVGRTEQVSGTVRREEISVDDTTTEGIGDSDRNR